ncbi:hypothetical protein M408DRAFT_330041, partial [Serendipita vermifera MAFF 305830]
MCLHYRRSGAPGTSWLDPDSRGARNDYDPQGYERERKTQGRDYVREHMLC